jgi:hypothetical protein
MAIELDQPENGLNKSEYLLKMYRMMEFWLPSVNSKVGISKKSGGKDTIRRS